MGRPRCDVEGCNVGASRDGFCGAHAPDRAQRQLLSMSPLVELVEARGGVKACGVSTDSSLARNYYQAKKRGTISPARGDRLSHGLLGCHPCEVWPSWFEPVENVR